MRNLARLTLEKKQLKRESLSNIYLAMKSLTNLKSKVADEISLGKIGIAVSFLET